MKKLHAEARWVAAALFAAAQYIGPGMPRGAQAHAAVADRGASHMCGAHPVKKS
jgi:hypothetical protein